MEVPEEEKEIGQQARLASIREQQASLAVQPLVRWLSTEAWLAATETLTPAEACREPTEARLAATETLTPAKARREPTEARLAAAMSLAPAEMPKQPRECSQRTPQPQQLRDQPKGHRARQQQELEKLHPLTWISHVARAKRTRCTTAGELSHKMRRLPKCGQRPRRMRPEDAGELGRQPKWQRH
jgi:hypothetical protein